MLQVVEFLGVRVRDEEEVRAFLFCDGHGAGDGGVVQGGAQGGQKAGFEGGGEFVEVLDLVGEGGGAVVLFAYRRVGLGGDF